MWWDKSGKMDSLDKMKVARLKGGKASNLVDLNIFSTENIFFHVLLMEKIIELWLMVLIMIYLFSFQRKRWKTELLILEHYILGLNGKQCQLQTNPTGQYKSSLIKTEIVNISDLINSDSKTKKSGAQHRQFYHSCKNALKLLLKNAGELNGDIELLVCWNYGFLQVLFKLQESTT